MSKSGKPPAAAAGERLRLLFERIETLTEEKKGLADDIKDLFGEAKSVGFDPAAMKSVLKLRKMTPEDRLSSLSMVEIYMQALGMSDVGLSEMAAEFLAQRSGGGEPEPGVDQSTGSFVAPSVPMFSGDQGADGEAAVAPLTVEDATRLGTEAHAAGKPVTANPFPPRDPRRAAWDTAWCLASGSDGMDIPEHLMSAKALEDRRKAAAEAERQAATDAAIAEAEKKAAAERFARLVDSPHYPRARWLVISRQNGSTSWLSRTLPVAHSDAAALMDALEKEGVLSGPDLKGVRAVLVPKEDAGDEPEG